MTSLPHSLTPSLGHGGTYSLRTQSSHWTWWTSRPPCPSHWRTCWGSKCATRATCSGWSGCSTHDTMSEWVSEYVSVTVIARGGKVYRKWMIVNETVCGCNENETVRQWDRVSEWVSEWWEHATNLLHHSLQAVALRGLLRDEAHFSDGSLQVGFPHGWQDRIRWV